MINIKPYTVMGEHYNEISEMCKETGEPVYLTKNGEGDLVVMDIDSFSKRESMLKLRENLLIAEEDRLSGKPGYSVKEVSLMMKEVIQEVCGAGTR